MKGTLVVVLGIVLLTGGCQQPAPQPVAAPPPQPPQAVPRPTPRETIQVTWSFEDLPDACVARAVRGDQSLVLSVRRDGGVEVLFTNLVRRSGPSRRLVAWRFDGAAGSVRMRAWPMDRHDLRSRMPLDDRGLARLLVLLSGGRLEVGDARGGFPVLQVPPSDASGQSWFDCAREKQL